VLLALWLAVFVAINAIRYAPIQTAIIAGSAVVIGVAAWRWSADCENYERPEYVRGEGRW
jgi:hypothetical protein